MKHYKNKQGQVFGFDDDQLHLVTPDMVEMTDAEFQEFCNPTPTPEQVKLQRIAELKQLLSTSDFKVLSDYQATKTQAENDAIIAQRALWRDEVRVLENEINIGT